MSIIPTDNENSIPTEGAILVVEDDECLRTIVRMMFNVRGWKVYTACDGEEGEQAFLSHQDEIVLVMVDLGLPKIEGVELVRRFRLLKPMVKIIVTSGYNDQEFIANLLKNGVDAFLKKPFNQSEFYTLIRQFLQDKSE
ncbi:MAG: response regulator [Bacteroidota bacterium]